MAHNKDTDNPTTEDATPAVDENVTTNVDGTEATVDNNVDAQASDNQPEVDTVEATTSATATNVEPEAEAGNEEDATIAEEPVNNEIAQLRAELEQAQEEAAKNLENWQRTAAELANYKRRQEEQFKLQRDRIKSEVLEGVISALDDLDLAFQNLPEDLNGQLIGWVEGFRLVQRKLGKILDDQNVMPIDTAGQFDPNFHEAVSYEDAEDHDTDHIIAELRKGYQIGSRVIRPALVRVAR
ncbi:MAG: nucleotide exchange factor GrpE [Anaerolineae bacterium]|nr:nucleotide exchange factor GrpE [Anaerolineae bacterium]